VLKLFKKGSAPCINGINFGLFNGYQLLGFGPGSQVGIVTDYGLDGPGSNPGGDEIFRPSRPAMGLTQPPVK